MWLRRLAPLAMAALCVPALVAFAPAPLPTVVVYGDSLTVQSEKAAAFFYRDVKQKVVFRATGGTAMCDWIAQAAIDQKVLHPSRVVLAFTGNSASCAKSALLKGGAAGEVALYEHSLRQMRAAFPTAAMSIVIPPAMHDRIGWFPFDGNPQLVAMYKKVGAALKMKINTQADDALTPGHVFVQKRPAFPWGPLVDVRLSDGVHLTPAGALWYGAALLAVIR
jgi:hypothetical protein